MLKNGEGGDGRREVCLPARGCGVEAPHVLRRPGCGHGVTTLGMPTRRDLRQWVRHDRRRLATGLTADDTGDLMGTPAGVEHSCDLALEQGAQPARHQIPPALKAQPLRQCVDQRPQVCAVTGALAFGVRRRQDQLVDYFVSTGGTPQTLSARIGLPPAPTLPLLNAPLRLLHAAALSVLGTHQQMT